MAYVQYGHMTEAERQQQHHKQQIEQAFKELGEWQATILNNLRIAYRNGRSKELSQQMQNAADHYGELFEQIMAACPERQKQIARR
jgi:hypothetical protein